MVTACWGQFKVPKGTKEIQGCHRITVILKRTVENWKEAATSTLHLELHLPVCLGMQPILGHIQPLNNLPTSLSPPFPTQTLDNQNLWKFVCIAYATFKMGLLYTVCSVVVLRSHSYSAPGSGSLYLLQKRLTPIQSMFTFPSLTPSNITLKNLTLENKDNSNLSYRW